jgi:hypothetical protein
MTRSTIKLRPRDPEIPERKLRLRLPGRLAADLEEYRALYSSAHRQDIELPALIESILEQFLASDRAFQRRRRGTQPKGPGREDRGATGNGSIAGKESG